MEKRNKKTPPNKQEKFRVGCSQREYFLSRFAVGFKQLC